MGRYYFHLYDDDVALDHEGVELPDLAAARARAFASAREIAGGLNVDFDQTDNVVGLDIDGRRRNWTSIRLRRSPCQLRRLIDASKSPYLVRMTGKQDSYDLSAAPSTC